MERGYAACGATPARWNNSKLYHREHAATKKILREYIHIGEAGYLAVERGNVENTMSSNNVQALAPLYFIKFDRGN